MNKNTKNLFNLMVDTFLTTLSVVGCIIFIFIIFNNNKEPINYKYSVNSNEIVQYLTDIKFTEKEFSDIYYLNPPGFNIKYNEKSIIVTGKIRNITHEDCNYDNYKEYLKYNSVVKSIKIVLQNACTDDFINLKIGDEISVIGKYYKEINESPKCGCFDHNISIDNTNDYSIKLINCYIIFTENVNNTE
jgi:hypothetical protein